MGIKPTNRLGFVFRETLYEHWEQTLHPNVWTLGCNMRKCPKYIIIGQFNWFNDVRLCTCTCVCIIVFTVWGYLFTKDV